MKVNISQVSYCLVRCTLTCEQGASMDILASKISWFRIECCAVLEQAATAIETNDPMMIKIDQKRLMEVTVSTGYYWMIALDGKFGRLVGGNYFKHQSIIDIRSVTLQANKLKMFPRGRSRDNLSTGYRYDARLVQISRIPRI